MPGSYQQALDDAEKVVKRQRACAANVTACFDALIKEVGSALASSSSAPGQDSKSRVHSVLPRLQALITEANAHTKELHGAVNRLSKSVDACVDGSVDISKVLRAVPVDTHTLHMVIAEHLFRQGQFEVGHLLAQEAGLGDAGEALSKPFVTMHTLLEQIHAHNPTPALDWAAAHLTALNWYMSVDEGGASTLATEGGLTASGSAGGGEGAGSVQDSSLGSADGMATDVAQRGGPRTTRAPTLARSIRAFQFRLHALSFLSELTQHGTGEALRYAQAHFPGFSATHMRDIQRLMGCLVYFKRAGLAAGPGHSASPPPDAPTSNGSLAAGQTGDVVMRDAPAGSPRPPAPSDTVGPGPMAHDMPHCVSLDGTPYAHLLSASAWQEAAEHFVSLSCSLMGLPTRSPLATVLAAGAASLPRLHKLVSVLAPAVGAELRTSNQLPIELELGPEFVFHPIFACPVSRDQSTPDNPPLLLPCNHVLCEQSVLKIAKSRTRVFKCPYCPVEARADNLRPLVFPPLDHPTLQADVLL